MFTQYFVNIFYSCRGKIVMNNRDHKEVKPVSPYKNVLNCYNSNIPVQEHIGT